MLEPTDALEADIARLLDQLAVTIARHEGEEVRTAIEAVSSAVAEPGSGAYLPDEGRPLRQIAHLLRNLSIEEATSVLRALTMHFHLINVADQANRVDVFADTDPRRANRLENTLERLIDSGVSSDEIGELVDRLVLRPVFTAHPTEATRRAILTKQALLADWLWDRHAAEGDALAIARIDRRIDEIIDVMWQTDELRSVRPEPDEEAWFVINYLVGTIRDIVPDVLDKMGAVLGEHGVSMPRDRSSIKFGAWVRSDETERVLEMHRRSALELLIDDVSSLQSFLSLSVRVSPVSPELAEWAMTASEAFPDAVRGVNDAEPYRLGCAVAASRLRSTLQNAESPGAFDSADDLVSMYEVFDRSLRQAGASDIADGRLARSRALLSAVGFHLAAINVRVDADAHHGWLEALYSRLDASYPLDDSETRLKVLSTELEQPRPLAGVAAVDALTGDSAFCRGVPPSLDASEC